LDQAPENQNVNGVKNPPVKLSQQSARLKPGAAANQRPVTGLRRNQELQPGTTRELHFCPQKQTAVRLQILHVPKVNVIILVQMGAAGVAFHTNSSQASVQPAADAPQAIRVEIPVRTAEVCNDGEHVLWGRVGDRLADVAQNAVPPSEYVRRTARKSLSQGIVR
jgi:hypothetical protein